MTQFYEAFMSALIVISAIVAAFGVIILALFLMVLGWMIVEHLFKVFWNYTFGTDYRSPFDQ